MHLKKLIVSGFKSFADKVTLNFDQGITGIVGPNGSGKSNVIDSVRWVMGEQNAKHLRGQVATDIIFAGSDKRKALAMAEVTLVFDNADQSSFAPIEYRHEPEIALTRRMYVDGQREYLINKKPCRLKDIVNFFTTTGLGGRSYSMIQQGQVDRILNAKPEDVREILEEAAGTIVFRNRRDSAQKKLEATRDNLSRIDDIVVELERQLEGLREQVEKAKTWKELSSELKEKELSVFSYNFLHFTAKLQEFSNQLETAGDRELAATTSIQKLEFEVEKLQEELAEADPELEFLREDIAKLRESIARAEGALISADESIEYNENRLIEIEASSEEDQGDLTALKQQTEQAQIKYDTALEELNSFQDKLEVFQAEMDEVDESAQVFSSRSDHREQEIRQIDRDLESNALRCEAIERERRRLSEDSSDQTKRIDRLQEDASSIRDELQIAQQKVDRTQQELDSIALAKQESEEKLAELEDLAKLYRNQKDDKKEALLHKRARVISLEELASGVDDLREGVSKLNEERPDLSLKVLADLFTYKTNDPQISIQQKRSLEFWLERLLVDSFTNLQEVEKIATKLELSGFPVTLLEALDILDENNISSWKDRFSLKSAEEFLQIASNDPRLEKLLTRICFSQSNDYLNLMVAELPKGVVLISLQGSVTTGELITHLAQHKGSGALTRKAELESLSSELIDLQLAIENLEGLINETDDQYNELRLSLKQQNSHFDQQNKASLEVFSALRSIKQKLEYNETSLVEAKNQASFWVERDRKLIDELSNLGEARINLGIQRDEAIVELESLREEFSEIEDRRQEIQRMLQQQQVDFAKVETKCQGLKEQLEQAQSQLQRQEASFGRRKEERTKIDRELESARDKKAQAEQEMESFLVRREQLEEELNVRREKSADILDKLKRAELSLKQERELFNKLQQEKSQHSFESERLREACKNLQMQADEKYQVNLLDYKVSFDEDFDPEAISKQAQSLKRKIDSLGAINMVAVEEYERLSERYNFIQGQKEEVLASILLLEEAISEIEDTSREKFLVTFDIINENFQSLFPILFPGGEARLELSDREDVLSAGVEIMVRMPGKMPRSMTLYSGGEKALTAISLIFALLKTKPTPFCFLDEVDAPLDEANVGRYNKVLQALADRFQFIVITHNRRTMEVLDQLYGVTMQEGGVSTVVGVDMRKDLPAHLQKAFEVDSRPGASAN